MPCPPITGAELILRLGKDSGAVHPRVIGMVPGINRIYPELTGVNAPKRRVYWEIRDSFNLLWQVKGTIQVVEINILVRPHRNQL